MAFEKTCQFVFYLRNSLNEKQCYNFFIDWKVQESTEKANVRHYLTISNLKLRIDIQEDQIYFIPRPRAKPLIGIAYQNENLSVCTAILRCTVRCFLKRCSKIVSFELIEKRWHNNCDLSLKHCYNEVSKSACCCLLIYQKQQSL